MKTRDLKKLGIPKGAALAAAQDGVHLAKRARLKTAEIRDVVRSVLARPRDYEADPLFGALAKALLGSPAPGRQRETLRAEPAPYTTWGRDFDAESLEQLLNACSLPVSVRGALMPDAHVGYGLPIGGVLATENAVIPYAVGVDIACRMKLSVIDLPLDELAKRKERFADAIHAETRFGIGAAFERKRLHAVMDRNWNVSPVTQRFKDKAWSQLGTSGSGNHFVEFGELVVEAQGLPLAPGRYLALLSHSGSRGTGASVCDYYSKLAMRRHPDLPHALRHLAWLDLDSEDGQEYWAAMELMGAYAHANHECIHRHVIEHLGARLEYTLENHHNFAWKERHYERDVVVHRKGATPAGAGVLGIIPGSMATPGFIVRGKGKAESLESAAHGAGRRMSRGEAKRRFSWREAGALLEARGVTLLSAGLDEVPMAYKDIEEVMRAQADLVDPLARFHPRLVKMAPSGERPED